MHLIHVARLHVYTAMHVHIHVHVILITLHMCTHTHTCGSSQQMMVHCALGVGGGRSVSVGGVSQLSPLNMNHRPLSSLAPE